MKIACNARKIGFMSASLLALLLATSTASYAAGDTAGAFPPPMPASTEPVAVAAALPTNTSSGVPMGSIIGGGNRARNLAPLEDKVSESVKNVVHQLGSTESVSLEDLNSARQAVAKLEVLIDIEKRLAELDKIRNSSGEKSIASAIPASALTPPPAFALPAAMPRMPSSEPPVFNPPVRGDVSRISGADGHYTATVQGKSVRIGDVLSDGSTVISISAKQVETKSKDGSVHELKVKGVEQVFGHTL